MKIINKLILIGLIAISFSCEDILEEDITNDIVQIVYPTEGITIESNVATFQWNHLDGADDYRVQIYTGNQFQVFDTLVNTNTVTLPLIQGTYQWRVRGENSAYESTYTFPITFDVNESEDLTNQLVILSAPSSTFATNQNSITLSWETLTAADYYEVLVTNTTSGNIAFTDNNVTATNITLNSSNITGDGQYSWKVKAYNNTTSTETQFSTRNFLVDTVVPNQPQNNQPANNTSQTINQTVSFSWTIPLDSGIIQSAISYEIQIASDINFTTIIQSSPVSVTSFQQSFTAAGIYYWRVRAKDAALNTGAYSSGYKLTIN
ncbi:hypothetical protein FIA58_017155 [Flavobacterium jejuense]|uniref:Fibronectin type-III domain-containing protein n=1 Tax=Flavobacterium jejuense TaxID=1544455 RepID=A0ABX0IV19_9FLAO|nr:hypothetical protein [Flavobacterium jejuense]NHN27411.1 hypothetical protein [Flavobacterium jejuense]